MALWGSKDAASNSTIFAASQVKVTPNTANRDALFGNTTANAYIAGVTVGQFGVDANEVTAGRGAVSHTGWVLRTVGQGGRAGRVMTEVLVAGGITTDAEDTVYPDYVINIITQPSNATANSTANEQATFTVVASTSPAGGVLSYQWVYANGDALGVSGYSGDTTAALTVDANTVSNGESYKVSVSTTGGAANVVSSNATITITT